MPSAVWQHFERLERGKDDPVCRKYLAISASSSNFWTSEKIEQANMIIFLAENL